MTRKADHTSLIGSGPSEGTVLGRARAGRLVKPEIAAEYIRKGEFLGSVLSEMRKRAKGASPLPFFQLWGKTRSDF